MNEDAYEHYRDIPEGECNFLVPTTLEMLKTSVREIMQNQKGEVTLVYMSGEIEATALSAVNIVDTKRSFPELVKLVQGVIGSD